MIQCEYWENIDKFFLGKCRKELFRGQPNWVQCITCEHCNTTAQQMDTMVKEHLARKKVPPQLPSVPQMAKNFAVAAIKHAASGMKKRNDEEVKRLITICNGCDFYFKNTKRCSKCGCFMNVKARWATANCPIGKW